MAAVLWLSLILPSCLLDNTRDTSVMHEKAKFVCFIYMQPQKVKFKFVQINMKQVSYINDPQKKHRLKTVSKNTLLEGLNLIHGVPTSPLVQVWIKTHRCLVCIQDP